MNRTNGLGMGRGYFPGMICAILLAFGAADAAEIAVDDGAGNAGEIVEISVRAKGIENLAGVKLVLAYDKDKLVFEQADKTPLTHSLMHIVNSRTAGNLIVVMAGARGVRADDGAIVDLRFRVPENGTKAETTRVELREVQVMSDQLREIHAEAKGGVVALNGAAESEKEVADARPSSAETSPTPDGSATENAPAEASPVSGESEPASAPAE